MDEELRQKIMKCTECHLHKAHKGPVPGLITNKYGILIIGEAPGNEEDMSKMPFVGRSGRYLRMKLKEIKLPSRYVSYANVISCRPTGKDNRNPRDDEIAACRNNLLLQLRAAQPRIVVTVGAISSKVFYPNIRLANDHGRPVWLGKHRIQIPTYHPAFVLRKKREWEGVFEKDLLEVKKRAYGRLNQEWPEDCRVCGVNVERYDTFGLAYCNEHYVDSMKVTLQPGMV